MTTRVFRLQIVYPNGEMLKFDGGSAVERQIVDAIAKSVSDQAPTLVEEIISRGVGLLRGEAHVRADVEAALEARLSSVVKSAVEAVILDLKRETVKAVL